MEKLCEVPSGGSVEYWSTWERVQINIRDFIKPRQKTVRVASALTKISKPHCDYHLAKTCIEYSTVSKMMGSYLLESLKIECL